jgi:drug/metabolite transporter (DMT)-like permease
MTQQPEITWKSWAMIATLGIVWGGTFLLTEIALEGITPFWLAAGRISFATLVMASIWAARGFVLFKAPPTNQVKTAVVCIAALSAAIPFSLLAWGQQHVTSGFAGVSMASVTLIVLPLAHFFLPGERLRLRRAVGFSIGFVGVVILIGAQAFESSGAGFETIGRIACVAAAACYSVSSVVMRRLPTVDPMGLATVLLILATMMTVPVALIIEGVPDLPDKNSLLVLAILGLIPTAAANLLRVLVIRSAGPVFMSLVNYQVPVWSVVLGAVVLSEPLPSSLIWAMGLILIGVAISQWGALTRLFRNAP